MRPGTSRAADGRSLERPASVDVDLDPLAGGVGRVRGEPRDVVLAATAPADREPVVALDRDVAEALRLQRLDRRVFADEEASSELVRCDEKYEDHDTDNHEEVAGESAQATACISSTFL